MAVEDLLQWLARQPVRDKRRSLAWQEFLDSSRGREVVASGDPFELFVHYERICEPERRREAARKVVDVFDRMADHLPPTEG